MLACMALDYLSIPATSINVEHIFSHGRLVLSHVRSQLSVQSMRALICVGAWSCLGLIKTKDIFLVAMLTDIKEDVTVEMLGSDWDALHW
jgi:hAT family C-terminal dimerisation region